MDFFGTFLLCWWLYLQFQVYVFIFNVFTVPDCTPCGVKWFFQSFKKYLVEMLFIWYRLTKSTSGKLNRNKLDLNCVSMWSSVFLMCEWREQQDSKVQKMCNYHICVKLCTHTVHYRSNVFKVNKNLVLTKTAFTAILWNIIIIYINADAFIQSDLQCIQVKHFLSVCVFPGNLTHNLLCC